ncbi:unnamed protein product [Vicia faba]|uniref:ubiquitinyl hydrolase 1 n=1 Tax=Vicia faba TaxID=3906 RepID=A0AAV1BE04_VICFA|nr:unnamed protein product [Vicia faba]
MKKTLWFRQTLTIRAAVTGIATVAAAGIIFVLKDTRSSKPFTSLALASCVCFQSFLDSVIAEYENDDENMPLVFSLASLLQELSLVSTENVVLSPINLMRAMSSYIPDFDLTSQQDAAEAFVHLLCSLREVSGDGLADLTCQTCSSQISNKFENFDCLPLSPVLSNSYTVRVGCTLVDCLKQFIVAEHIENYHCSHCWHNAAIKYLSLMEGDKVELGKLRRCSDQEFCDCQKTYNLENLPWSNRFSHALKQLNIARCPRILCIQLKRAHMNDVGESFKLQGHISFPLILDASSFMTTRLGVNIQEDVQSLPLNMQYSKKSSMPNHSNLHSEIRTIKSSAIYGEAKEQIDADTLIHDVVISATSRQELAELPCSGSSQSIHSNTQLQSNDKVDVSCNSVSQDTCLYQLVSVVEHFGRTGGGHYSVYRCVRSESSDVSGDRFNQNSMHWFRVSDSHVDAVSVDDVVSAEASLLFYERIPNN